MGSRSKTHIAYIAGFLDGDGSLMLQVKKRSDTRLGVRFMTTICLYQDTRHEEPLYWIKKVFGIGYLSQRSDGISELRINGYKQVHDILVLLQPFVRFKKVQTKALIEACKILSCNPIQKLTKQQLKRVIDLAFVIKKENYKSRGSRTKEELYERLGLTP